MRYTIIIKQKAEKALSKLHDPEYTNIKNAILSLSTNPRPNGYIKLKDREGYRIRVGKYRILYRIIDDILVVEIVNLGHRGAIYRRK